MKCYPYKPSGRQVWYYCLQFAWMQREERRSLKTRDERVAKKRLDAIREEREHEHHGIIAPKAQRAAATEFISVHLADFLAHLRESNRDPKHVENYDLRLSKLIDKCEWKRLADVTAESFLAWRRSAQLKGKTKNQYLSMLHNWMRWLHRSVQRIGCNPVADVERIDTRRESKEQKRAFTDVEMTRLLRTKQGVLYLVAACTGLRHKELRLLTWGNCKLDSSEPVFLVTTMQTKNKKFARLPMFGTVAQELRVLRPVNWRHDQRVFAKVPGDTSFAWHRDKCGIPKLDDQGRKACFHSLRVTFNTMLQRQGRGEAEVMQLMRVVDRKLIDTTYMDGDLVLLGGKAAWWSIERSPGARTWSGLVRAFGGTKWHNRVEASAR